MLLGKVLQQGTHSLKLSSFNPARCPSRESSKRGPQNFHKSSRTHRAPTDTSLILQSFKHQQHEAIKILQLISAEETHQNSHPHLKMVGSNKRLRSLSRQDEKYSMEGWIQREARSKTENSETLRGHGAAGKQLGGAAGKQLGGAAGKQLGGAKIGAAAYHSDSRLSKKRQANAISKKNIQLKTMYSNQALRNNASRSAVSGRTTKRPPLEGREFSKGTQNSNQNLLRLNREAYMKFLTIDSSLLEEAPQKRKKLLVDRRVKKLLRNQDHYVSYAFQEEGQEALDGLSGEKRMWWSRGKLKEGSQSQLKKLERLLVRQKKGCIKFDFDRFRQIQNIKKSQSPPSMLLQFN